MRVAKVLCAGFQGPKSRTFRDVPAVSRHLPLNLSSLLQDGKTCGDALSIFNYTLSISN